MYNKLKKILNNSYSPFSGYKVSAIAISKDGYEFEGVNVESSSFGATICAERTAIFNAITSGVKKGDIKEIHLMTFNTKMDVQKTSTPCGICRQVISEMSNQNAKIFIYNYDTKEVIEKKISHLLPGGFSEGDLIV